MASPILIAGNWKMNGLRAEAEALARAVAAQAHVAEPGCDVAVCPPFTALEAVRAALGDAPIALGGQDCHAEAKGAFTGSVSAEMLGDAGCACVIVGHSERRHGLGETDEQVLAKAEAALRAGLTPIVCVGETLEQRDAGDALAVVGAQIEASVPPAGDEAGGPGSGLVVAYEPVWAIGTGRVPTGEDIAAMHREVRARLTALRPDGALIRILYGGSAKPGNAADLLAVEEVGGLLIGGASLDADDFWAMVEAGAEAASRFG